MPKNRALLIGNYKDAQYHPLKNIDTEIVDILKDGFDVTCTEDIDYLKSDKLSTFDLFISYADYWEQKLDQERLSSILSFVCSGKGMLAIHTGISYQKNYEFAQMIGGKFTSHPEFCKLDYHVASKEHPVMDGINSFSAGDEPYQFEMDNFSEKTILFEYNMDGINKPAGWALFYGLGRVIYLMPGHTVEPFKNAMYRNIISNSAKWLMNH